MRHTLICNYNTIRSGIKLNFIISKSFEDAKLEKSY